MTRYSAYSRLLVSVLILASFGCQATRGAQQSSVAGSVAEQAAQPAATSPAQVQDVAASVKEQPTAQQKVGSVMSLKDQKDKASYMVGLDLGKDLRAQELGLNIEPLLQGIRDSLEANQPLLKEAELEKVKDAFVKERLAARARAIGPEAEKNLKEGEAFLQANAKKEGVTTLPSGLQYKVLKSGDGSTPTLRDNVKAHFVVKTLDGKELESSYAKNAPGVFPVDGMIPAWNEAFQRMKVGDKWELYAPSYMAYGEKGGGSVIGPFQALIFELELLGIH